MTNRQSLHLMSQCIVSQKLCYSSKMFAGYYILEGKASLQIYGFDSFLNQIYMCSYLFLHLLQIHIHSKGMQLLTSLRRHVVLTSHLQPHSTSHQ